MDKAGREADARDDRELRLILGGLGEQGIPLGKQAEAENQANEWGMHWGEEEGQVSWKGELRGGGSMTELTVARLDSAAKSFPARTGFGWDVTHPRAITRLPYSIQKMLVRIFQQAEVEGTWPTTSHEVVVSMLAKPAGGYRPINLLRGSRRRRRTAVPICLLERGGQRTMRHG